MKLFVLFLLVWNTQVYAESVTKLEICQGQCECKPPMLGSQDSFVFAPGRQKEKILQCNLNLKSIENALKCLDGLDPWLASCANHLQTPKQDIDCDNLKYEFDYPATYIVGDKAPSDCGYQWKGFNSKEYVHVVSNFLETEKLACTKSMCTSAAFLALAHKAKTLYQQNKISKEDYKKLTTPGGVAYQILNGSAEPNELVEHFGLGSGHIIYPRESKDKNWNIPQAGDITQIWRNNKSGHSVVFKGFVDKDNDGKNDYICYWSSQTRTNGYGNVCEPLSSVDKLLVGHFDV